MFGYGERLETEHAADKEDTAGLLYIADVVETMSGEVVEIEKERVARRCPVNFHIKATMCAIRCRCSRTLVGGAVEHLISTIAVLQA